MEAKTKFQFGDLDPEAELANLARHHIITSVCAGGKQVLPNGPCDHCGSVDPSNTCLFGQRQTIGTPLQTE